jgi:hypothetical protein
MADELDEIREAEEANYKTSLKVLGDSVSLVQDLLDVHKLIAATAPKTKLILKAEHYTTLHFTLLARYHLTIGSLATLRAHLSDAIRSGRMAIEAAAFAARMKRHPALAAAWIDANQDDDTYERYLRSFSGGKIFPEKHAVLRELGRRFDVTSRLSHPSIYALAEHVRTVKTGSGVEVKFHYFPVDKDDHGEPARTFFWTIDTHFGVLRIFVEVLADTLMSDRKAIDLRMNGVDAKLSVHKERWPAAIIRKPDKASVSPSGLILLPPVGGSRPGRSRLPVRRSRQSTGRPPRPSGPDRP